MRTNTISYVEVVKRNIALHSVEEHYIDAEYLYRNAKSSIENETRTLREDTSKFILGCTDSVNANKYYHQCIDILEHVSDEETSKRLVDNFKNQVLPYVEDLQSLKEVVEVSSLKEDVRESLLSGIKGYKVCDRVLKNNRMINKRFNMENIVESNRHSGLENLVLQCCTLIDTYDSIPSHGKLNITLEQLSYYLQKYQIPYEGKDFVDSIMEYYLLRKPTLPSDERAKYINVLKENIFISDEDLEKVSYFVHNECGILESANYADSNDVKELIDKFKADEKKDLGKFKYGLESIFKKSPEAIVNDSPSILSFLRYCVMLATFGVAPVLSLVMFIGNVAAEWHLEQKQTDKLLRSFESEMEKTEKQMDKVSGDKYDDLKKYYDCLEVCKAKIENYRGGMYTKEKEDDDESFNESVKKLMPMKFKKFKIFKFQNLITAAMAVDGFIERKGNKATDFIKKKSKQIFKASKKFLQESNDIDILAEGYITEENNFDMCLAIYELQEESDLCKMHDEMTALCRYINNTILYKEESTRVYYEVAGNLFKLHLEDGTYLILDDKEEAIKENTLSNQDILFADTLLEYTEQIEKLSKIDINNLIPNTINYIEEVQCNNVNELFELLSYTGIATKKDINTISECYIESYGDNYLTNSILSYQKENWRNIDVPFTLQVEAIDMLNQVVTEKIDLNSIQLSMEGLKKKVKDLSAKEQEIARNLDATVNMFSRSIKQAMVSDRREAIIKGSVIPSFSKAMKLGLALAGIAKFIDPTAAIITTFVGLALSKNLTRKERSLMLDEIDIELKALEKEISFAEDAKNMKKYRALMVRQKKLQRERQRIKYNIKAGGDLPDSNVD